MTDDEACDGNNQKKVQDEAIELESVIYTLLLTKRHQNPLGRPPCRNKLTNSDEEN